jgi:hypothetical protein
LGKLNFRRLVLAEGIEGYGSAAETTQSGPESPQASITLHDIAPGDLRAGALTVTASGTLADTGSARLSIEVKRDDQWRFSLTKDSGSARVVNISLAENRFDLRLIAVRRLSRIDPNDEKDPRLYAWYELLLLVRPQGKTWVFVAQEYWFDPPDNDTSTKILNLQFAVPPTWTDRGRLSVDTKLQISEATEGLWTQFLPNAEMLARTARVPLKKLKLTLLIKENDKNSYFTLTETTGTGIAWLGTDALTNQRKQGESDQGLFNLLLVTRRVASVSGTEEESYVGLYYSPSDQRPGDKGALPLQPFGRVPPNDTLVNADLVGRILTIRAHNPNVASDAIGGKDPVASWKEDPWEQFFPSEEGDEYRPLPDDGSRVFGKSRPKDTRLQIIEIYAPVDITH